MEGGQHVGQALAGLDPAALPGDAEPGPEERLGRGGAEGHDERGLHRGELALEPLVAGLDLALCRGLVQAAFAARLPLEVLHRIGDVELRPVEARLMQRLVEDAPGGADERMALAVLDVPGLLADQHDACARTALAENGLRSVLPQGAGAAIARFFAQLLYACGRARLTRLVHQS